MLSLSNPLVKFGTEDRREELVPPTRIERATRGLGNRCSIQLSYGGVNRLLRRTAPAVQGTPWARLSTQHVWGKVLV